MQGWNVFVPVPNSNYKLFVEFESGGAKKSFDLFREIKNKHQANRLSGYEPLLLAFSGCIYVIEKKGISQGLIKDDITFKLLENATKGYLRHYYNKNIKDVKMLLLVNEINTLKQKIYYN